MDFARVRFASFKGDKALTTLPANIQHHSASLYVPICPLARALSVNLKLLLSIRDIIVPPPLHYVILCIIALTVERVAVETVGDQGWFRIKG